MAKAVRPVAEPDTEKVVFQPSPGPQTAFLSSNADICIYGGAAGGGKTFGLLAEAARNIKIPGYRAVVFRRTAPQVRNPGGLWDQATQTLGRLAGVRFRPDRLECQWGVGSKLASIKFANMELEHDRFNFSGAEIAMLGFDELQMFLETQFWFMLSRNRSTCGVKPYVRASCNPVAEDDRVGGWLNRFLAWWIDAESGLPIPERQGKKRWFIRQDDKLIWASSKAELSAEYPDDRPLSVAFIAANLHDNPVLMAADPNYLGMLRALPRMDRERLLEGRWNVRPAAGIIFNRGWFPVVDSMPVPSPGEKVSAVRYWDKAGSSLATADRTAGVRMVRMGSRFIITDAIAFRKGALEREQIIKNLASQDGQDTTVWIEQEPGSGGLESAEATIRNLVGFRVHAHRATGSKVTTWGPLSAQAEGGNVFIVRGAWNEDLLRELHNADGRDGHADDLVDATAGAFMKLAGTMTRSFA